MKLKQQPSLSTTLQTKRNALEEKHCRIVPLHSCYFHKQIQLLRYKAYTGLVIIKGIQTQKGFLLLVGAKLIMPA